MRWGHAPELNPAPICPEPRADHRRQSRLSTMTADKHFIVDRHPAHEQVAIGRGFSGHGYTSAPVIGEILADIMAMGATDHPTSFLPLHRFLGMSANARQKHP
jgi:glycine/D-amino acid oxidase-like deaminating enzyme